MPHSVLRLQVTDNRHVLVDATVPNDLLPLRNGSSVLLFN